MSYCVSCGESLVPNANFCMKCGAAVGAVQKRVCPKCQSDVGDGFWFCPKCAHKLDIKTDGNESVSNKEKDTVNPKQTNNNAPAIDNTKRTRTLTIRRELQFSGCVHAFEVHVDGNFIGKIMSGGVQTTRVDSEYATVNLRWLGGQGTMKLRMGNNPTVSVKWGWWGVLQDMEVTVSDAEVVELQGKLRAK